MIDAYDALASDEMFGDFEDLETGEVHEAADEKEDGSGDDEGEEDGEKDKEGEENKGKEPVSVNLCHLCYNICFFLFVIRDI